MRGWEKAMAACPLIEEANARFRCIHGTLKACMEDVEILLKADEVRK